MATVSWLASPVHRMRHIPANTTLKVQETILQLLQSAATELWMSHARDMIAWTMRGARRLNEVIMDIHNHNNEGGARIEITESDDRFHLSFEGVSYTVYPEGTVDDHDYYILAGQLKQMLDSARCSVRDQTVKAVRHHSTTTT